MDIPIDLFPGRTLTLFLFDGVTNAAELKAAMSATTNPMPNVAFLDASMIVSPYVLAVAATKALQFEALGKLRTGCIGKELLFALHPSRSVAEALRTFGVRADSSRVAVAVFDRADGGEAVGSVAGTAVAWSAELSDAAALTALYKVGAGEADLFGLESAVVSRVASRDV